jgi:hypothetical protein
VEGGFVDYCCGGWERVKKKKLIGLMGERVLILYQSHRLCIFE